MKAIKHIFLFIVSCLFTFNLYAQHITQVQYWFDNNFANAVTTSVNMSGDMAELDIPFTLSADMLLGKQIINFRFKDNKGNWSAILNSPIIVNLDSSELTKDIIVEYWYDNNINNKKQISLTDAGNSTDGKWLGQKADMPWQQGAKYIYYRFKGKNNTWSPIITSDLNTNDHYANYNQMEYWFDNDFANRKRINIQQHIGSDPNYATFFNNDVVWKKGSSTIYYRLFDKFERTTPIFVYDRNMQPYYVNYTNIEYWFGNDFANRKTAKISKHIGSDPNYVSLFNNDIDWKKGETTMYYRLSDNLDNITPIYTYNIGMTKLKNNRIVKAEYWFNDRFEERKTKEITDKTDVIKDIISLSVNTDTCINVRYQDAMGNWSCIASFNVNENANKYHIVNLEPNINKLVPTLVKEYATLIYHYRITDDKDVPVQGVKVKTQLTNSKHIIESSESDEQGIVRIEVPVYGKDVEDKSDDIIPVYKTDMLEFVSLLSDSTTQLKCVGGTNIMNTIGVIPYKADSRTGTFTSGLSKNFGGNAVSADVGVGAGTSFTYNFNESNTAIKSLDIAFTGNINANANASINLGKTFKLNTNIDYNYYRTREVSGVYSYRIYLIALYNMFASAWNGTKLEKNHFVMSAIASYLEDEEHNMNFEFNDKFGVGMKIGAGFDLNANEIPIIKKQVQEKWKIPLNFNGNIGFSYMDGKKLNSNNTMVEKSTQKLSLSASGSVGGKYTTLIQQNLANGYTQYNLFGYTKSYGGKVKYCKNFSVSVIKKKYENLIDYESTTLKFGNKNAYSLSGNMDNNFGDIENFRPKGKIAYSKSLSNEFSVSKRMMYYITESERTNKPLISFANIKSSDFTFDLDKILNENLSNTESFISEEQKTKKYQQNEKDLEKDLHHHIGKSTTGELALGFPVTILGFNLEFDATLELEGSVPILDAYYHAESKRILPTIVYQDVNKPDLFIDLSFFTDIGDMLKEGLYSIKDELKERLISKATWVSDKVGRVIKYFSNDNSKRLYTKNLTHYAELKANPQKHRSIFTFEIPADEKAFNANTNFDFRFYYPGGDVFGVSAKQDTFIVISDIFFLSAVHNTDTLKKAPNGTFYLKSTVGKDDLEFLGLDKKTDVTVYHKYFDDSVWTNVGQAKEKLNINGLGIYALGVNISADTIAPTINIQTKTANNNTLIGITDNIGVMWKNVEVFVNGKIQDYKRESINTISVYLSDEQLKDSVYLNVKARDLAGNYSVAYNLVQKAKKYTITTTAYPTEGGVVTETKEYTEEEQATVIATANEGYKFINWTEDNNEVSKDAEYSFTVSKDISLIANFQKQTGIEDSNIKDISIYPNPTKSVVFIELPNNMLNKTLTIVDLSGKVIYSQNTKGNTMLKINMSKFSKGVYFVKIDNYIEKLIVQ